MTEKFKHIPVMLSEVVNYLNIQENKIYIDGTFGNGGYSEAILKYKNTKIIAFDRDPNTISKAIEFKQKYQDRFQFFNIKFSDIFKTLQTNHINKIDGLVLDVGVSSMQIDIPQRGFSFRFNSPLSMTMGINKFTAKDVINNYSEQELSNIFYKYGEDPFSKLIAKQIINKRCISQINTTQELTKLIITTLGEYKAKKSIPRIFQAIRIHVNDELNELKTILNTSAYFLNSNARLIVVSFHSLEDKIVKNFIKNNTQQKSTSRYTPNIYTNNFNFKAITKNAILPTKEEIQKNNRARSAKLRVIEKI